MEIFGYITIGFIIGRLSKLKVYIGYDNDKYEAADLALLRRR